MLVPYRVLVLGSHVLLCSSGLVQMSLSWADGPCDEPGSSPAGYYLCSLPALVLLCVLYSFVDVQTSFHHIT